MEHGDGGRSRQGMPAKPREELRNVAKNIADCTELHLARRGITHFNDDMEAFKSLEVLWINDNLFSRIANLDFNPTIKSLYAHNNKIRSLKTLYAHNKHNRLFKGSLLAFTFLHTLTLGNNCIDNLQGSLEILRLMRHLRYLELSGNPLAEETGYRLLVVKHLPWLEILDMHKITDQERNDARRTRLPKSWQASDQGVHGDSVRLTQDLAAKETESEKWEGRRGSISVPIPITTPDVRRTKATINKELSRIRRIVKQRRILLKEWFTRNDPRREEAVTQLSFTRCLRQHGLWPPSHDTKRSNLKRSHSSSSDGESMSRFRDFLKGEAGLVAGVLLEAFRVPTPARASFLGRDQTYLDQGYVDYVSFCGAVEPKCGGRDMDNRERELEKAWKKKSVDKASKHPPSDRKHNIAPERRSSRAGGEGEGGLDADCHQPAPPVRAPMACDSSMNKSQNASGVGGLDHWERIELRRALEAQTADGAGATTTKVLTREQVIYAMKSMKIRGRCPRIFEIETPASIDEDSLNQLSATASGNGNAISVEPTSSVGGPKDRRTNLDVLFDAAALGPAPTSTDNTPGAAAGRGRAAGGVGGGGGGNGGGDTGGQEERTADIGMLMQALEKGVSGPGGVGPLEWEFLSREEAAKGAKKLYREAAHAQRRMLLISDDENITVQQEVNRIRQNIAALTKNAALLETLASSSTYPWKTTAKPTTATGVLAVDEKERLAVSLARGHRRSSSSSALTARQRSFQQNKLPSLGRVDVFFATDFHGGPFQRGSSNSYGGRYNAHDDIGGSGSSEVLRPAVSLGDFECSAGATSQGRRARQLSSGHRTGALVTSARGGGRGGRRRLVGEPAEGAGRVWCTRRVMTAG